jgi:hypothetical protein
MTLFRTKRRHIMPRVIATLPKRQPAPPPAEYDMTGLAPKRPTPAEAMLIFLNEIEKDSAETAKQLKAVVNNLEAVIAAIERPKKWKFEIDRNFQTNRIQSVTAEVIEE